MPEMEKAVSKRWLRDKMVGLICLAWEFKCWLGLRPFLRWELSEMGTQQTVLVMEVQFEAITVCKTIYHSDKL